MQVELGRLVDAEILVERWPGNLESEGVQTPFVFGSIATGAAGAASDVDLLVVPAGGLT